jgi:putative spermidine/putrescine transport system permease protein
VVCEVLLVIVLSPLVLPTIVIAIAIYGVFATLQLTGSIAGLIAAHTILTLPIVLITVSTALADVPAELEYAAASLGASPFTAFITVTVPLIARGMIAGAVLAFMLSFDEVVIGMFLSGGDVVTLPKRMLDGIFYEMTPMLAAVSSLFVLANIVGVMLFLCTRVRIKQ